MVTRRSDHQEIILKQDCGYDFYLGETPENRLIFIENVHDSREFPQTAVPYRDRISADNGV
jgi:hypothetical protein